MFALPMQEGVPLRELKDSVVINGALDTLNLNLFFLSIKLKEYYNILKVLGVGGYRDENVLMPTAVKLANSITIKFYYTTKQISLY